MPIVKTLERETGRKSAARLNQKFTNSSVIVVSVKGLIVRNTLGSRDLYVSGIKMR